MTYHTVTRFLCFGTEKIFVYPSGRYHGKFSAICLFSLSQHYQQDHCFMTMESTKVFHTHFREVGVERVQYIQRDRRV